MKTKKRVYTKHGMTGTKLHEVWKEMRRRCNGTSANSIKYFERKITVSKDWHSALNFITWALDNGYREGLVLDRISNKSGYKPSNCRWVTPRQSANNKENTIFLEHKGVHLPLSYWADRLCVKSHTLRTRHRRGWSDEKIITTPIQKRKTK